MDCVVREVDILPVIKYYIEQAEIVNIFSKHLDSNSRTKIPTSQVLGVLIMNILSSTRPLYEVSDWFADYTDPKGEGIAEANKYNDDRLGRALDALYKADRQSMQAEIASEVIKVHDLKTSEIHNDSTSISFSGAYENQSKDSVQLKRGHNKDGRSEDKQIVFGLNITKDGGVPLSFRLYDGNQNDDTTHQANWNALRNFLKKGDFIYIADCKLCSLANLAHIHDHGGKFITVIPSCVTEHKTFLESVIAGEKAIEWTDSYIGKNQRNLNEPNTFRVSEGKESRDGYRIIWVHGSFKAATQKRMRNKQIEKVEQELRKIQKGLNKRNLKKRINIEKKVNQSIKKIKELIEVDLTENIVITQQYSGRGRPSKETQPAECLEIIEFNLKWKWNNEKLQEVERADGLYPLITNTDLEPIEVLKAYKNQAHLEKRFYSAKSVLEVAPVFLKNPERIEAIIFLYFIALMVIGLIERHLRNEMMRQEIEALRILPSKMKTKTPTWRTIRKFFRNIHLIGIREGNFEKESELKGLTMQHIQIISLLGVPEGYYEGLKNDWWNFSIPIQTRQL